MRTVLAIAIAALLAACNQHDSDPGTTLSPAFSETTTPDTNRSSSSRSDAITTDSERYSFTPGEHGAELLIRSSLHAPANQAMYVVNCNGQIATGLQSLRNDVWVDSWVGLINQCLSEPIVIQPGESHDSTLFIRRGAGSPVGGQGEIPPPGTYRVIWYGVLDSFDASTYPFGKAFPEEQRVSAPILIQ